MTDAMKKLLNTALKKSPTLVQPVDEAGIIKRVPLDSPQLNYLFGGGLAIGRMHRLRGPESSGKSTICNYMAGQLQRKLPGMTFGKTTMPASKKLVVYVDFERTFDMKHAAENGLLVDDEHFIYMTPDDIETASDTLADMIKTNELAAIILDSDAAAATRTMMVDPSGKANFGAGAKALGEFLRKMNILNANYHTTLFWVSQERANLQPMARLPAVTGGEAPKFYASTVNRTTKTDVIMEGTETAGIEMRVRNYKNKTGVFARTANIKLYYKGGFKPDEEYIQFLVDLDIVTQKGAYFTVPGEAKSIQGREKLQAWLFDHPEVYSEMKKKVDEALTGVTKLDANNVYEEEDFDVTQIDEPIEDDE